MVRAVLYPRAKLFSTAGGKNQAASILQEKVSDICQKIPAFSREIDWSKGATKTGKDYVYYKFKNGSSIENLAARESSRGLRFHSGLIEECVGVDQDALQQIVIPTMNVSRRCADGSVHEEESLNQAQIFITTAGYKNTYSYDKLMQLLTRMVTKNDAFVCGGTWRIPVVMGLQRQTFIQDLKQDSTFNPATFGREYESTWTGTIENAFFNGEKFDRCRRLNLPEHEFSKHKGVNTYYVLGVDVGRKGCQTVITVVKVAPRPDGPAVKNLVNIYELEDDHFEHQSIAIKRLYYRYHARKVVLDANGLTLVHLKLFELLGSLLKVTSS